MAMDYSLLQDSTQTDLMQYFEESFMEESSEEVSGTENDQTQSTVPATSNSNSTGQKPTNQKDEASKLCKLPIVRYNLFFCQFPHPNSYFHNHNTKMTWTNTKFLTLYNQLARYDVMRN